MINMRRYFITIVIALVSCVYIHAQTSQTSLLKRANEIKSQNDIYFWNQYTHPDNDTARIRATNYVLLEVNNERDANSQLSINDLMPYTQYITITRGNKKQVFAYIRKDEAAAIRAGGLPMPGPVPVTSPTPVHNPAIVTNPTPVTIPTPNVPRSFVPDAFVQRIVDTADFTAICRLLTTLKADGQVLQFGKLRDVEDYSSFDLILFDKQTQKVITLLSGTSGNGGMRTNLVTGYADALTNYPTATTAAIWFVKK